MEKYEGVNISKLYEEKFGVPAPFYDLAAEQKSMQEWDVIMIKAIENDEPYEVEYSDDPNIRY